nr:triple tyrosine motif-containing protein [uncultured Psychroserpens sp.]
MKRKGFRKYIVIFGILCCLILKAQELPPVQIYAPEQYSADNQNWAVSQSSDDHIFIANNKGLLEFNGESWKLYPSPKETVMRTVHVVDSLIYTGSYMEFGFWKRDAYGILNYTSLSSELNIPIVDDEQFWDISNLDDFVLFQSLDRIIIYNITDSSFKIVDSQTTLTKMFKVDDTIYFHSIDEGIFRIESGTTELLINDDLVRDKLVINIFDHDGDLLVQTQNDGFYLYKDEALAKWDITSNELLSQVSVYNSIRLKNNSFAIGTISNGIIYLNSDGSLNYLINQSNGLSNNTILSLYEDRDLNIWLALDNGINCINPNSPFSIYNDQKGTIGTVYNSKVYKNNLYLGTNQGLFYKPLNSNDEFKFIKGTQGQVWSLDEIYDTLFCAHNSGTYIINNDNAELIDNTYGTWKVLPIENNDKLLLEGTYEGLNVLAFDNGKWMLRNKIEGFDISSRFIETLGSETIFVSHEYKGVYKIQVDLKFSEVLKIDKDVNVSKGLNSSLLKYDDQIFYTYKEGVFKYDENLKTFAKDSLYSQVFKDQTYTSGKLVVTDKTNKLWCFSAEGINYISSGTLSAKPEIETISLPNTIRNSRGGYENIAHIEDHKYLFGSSSGYLIIDLDKIHEKDYQISINSVNRISLNTEKVPIDKTVIGDFENKENNIEFNFSISEYEKYVEAEYQYQLQGIYDDWSRWSVNSSELFKNLPFGDYTFNVRARLGDNISTNTASYNFSIDKPWYLTNSMIGLYVFGFIAFSFLMHNIYKRYYRKQRETLLETNRREMELKELETEQQLMQFKNEKLQQDVDNKNRELAISTMSLIKKNEFLNNIKEELKSANQNNELKPVIKIIDKNLNNTDDWKFFQEAFNNADKDFLKKVKAKHPKLTPNDLRLCAYLRLNLSSKEIAPLLNISPRSVEVKRYRLRKKMELAHESSLTNYILEI